MVRIIKSPFKGALDVASNDNIKTLTDIPKMIKTLTTAEAALKLEVSERTIRNMIERGSIHAEKMDPQAKSVYRIPAEEVQRILRERAKTQSQRSRV